jgi:protein-tyrosine phosphatase
MTLIHRHILPGLVAVLGCGLPAGEQSNELRAQSETERVCSDAIGVPAPGGALDARADQDGERSPPNGRPILANQLQNARDLGGTPLAGGAALAYGVLFRGPPLTPLGECGCRELAELGVATVIDLRIQSERDAKPQARCALEQASVVLAPLPVPYAVSPEDYIADLNATESIAEAFRVLGDDAAYPIYFHCTWGRDRSGVLAALILAALGADRQDIMQEYLLSRATVGAYPASLAAMLDELERRGGIDAYLAAAGVTPQQRATLRARAVAAR